MRFQRSLLPGFLAAAALFLSCGGTEKVQGPATGFGVVWEIQPPSMGGERIETIAVRVLQDSMSTGTITKELGIRPARDFFLELGGSNQVFVVPAADARTLTLVVDGLAMGPMGEQTVSQINDMIPVSGVAQLKRTVQLPPPVFGCDPISGMGCPNGQKCAFVPKAGAMGMYEFKCAAGGVKARGEKCSNDNECGLGTLCGCLGRGGTAPCTCRKFCEIGQDSRDCGMPGFCDLALPGTPKYRLCLDQCVVFQTMCIDMGDCKVLGASKVACVAPGVTAEGSSCSRSSDCARGLACFMPTATCQQQCDMMHPCTSGECVGGICSGGAMGVTGLGGGLNALVPSQPLAYEQLISGDMLLH